MKQRTIHAVNRFMDTFGWIVIAIMFIAATCGLVAIVMDVSLGKGWS